MKKTITISVDVEVMAEARHRIGNISKFCNEAMREVLQTEKPEEMKTLKDAKIKLAGKVAEIAELRVHMAELEKEAKGKEVVQVIQ